MIWKNSELVVHTMALPPKAGSNSLLNNGSIANAKNEAKKITIVNNGLIDCSLVSGFFMVVSLPVPSNVSSIA